MREVVLMEELCALHPARAAELLDELAHAARHGRTPEDLIALGALAGALERLPYEVAGALYEAAKAAGMPDVARLFFAEPGGVSPAPEAEQAVPGVARKLTLGERKALARGGREALARLLADPDVSVIRNVLANPRTTEKEVVQVAARRPARPDIQRAISASRWAARYHVRRALVMNPGTPGDLAVRLLPSLVEADLRLVAADAHLAEAVRTQARLGLARPRR
jgi:hypothetical protein